MSFRFRDHETFEAAFRRITKEQIAKAHKHMALSDDTSVSILGARKCMKRLRALMRLYRTPLGKSDFANENARYRDISRLLSGSRDRQAMLETVALLMGELDGAKDGVRAKTLKKALSQVYDLLGRNLSDGALKVHGVLEDQILRRRAIAMLDDVQQELGLLRLRGDGFKIVGQGFEQSYAKGRKDFLRARKSADDDDETLHDMRKTIQTHWRHLSLFKTAWPDFFEFRIGSAKRLALALGQHQDLCLVANFVRALPAVEFEPKFSRAVSKHISKRKTVLRKEVLTGGALLFADDPKDLSCQVERYWNIWAQEAAKTREGAGMAHDLSKRKSTRGKANPFKLADI